MTHNVTAHDLGAALLADARVRLMDESLPRIQTCLDLLDDDEIWARPNDNVVSVGNLALHLCGNVRQYIVAGLGGTPDTRERDSEFEERGPLPRAELIHLLESTLAEVNAVLERLDPASLLEVHRVQGEEQTGLSIITHVVEHFSYHTGQISLHVKLRKNRQLGYYDGRDLNIRNG